MPCYPDLKVPPCPLCQRPCIHPSDHHLVPRSRGGKETLAICKDCHQAVHATFSNRELEAEYSTVEALLGHPVFIKTVKFIARRDVNEKIVTDRRKDRTKRP